MIYEFIESRFCPGEWVVEAIGEDGAIYAAIFSGYYAKDRATEYAAWKNGQAIAVVKDGA